MALQPTVTRTRMAEYGQRGSRQRLNAGRLELRECRLLAEIEGTHVWWTP